MNLLLIQDAGVLMKKLLFLIVLTLILIANVEAAPTFLGPTSNTDASIDYTVDGIVYSIGNRSSDSDEWNYDNDIGYTGGKYTGYYIGTVTNHNNDSETDISNLIRLFLGDDTFSITSFEKEDVGIDNEKLSITITGWSDPDKKKDPIPGTWKLLNDEEEEQKISFYSVKGAKEYALYYVSPALIQGTWTTDHLLTPNQKNIPALSHFSGVIITSIDAVPEPATILLFGFGLIGLAGIGRRTIKI